MRKKGAPANGNGAHLSDLWLTRGEMGRIDPIGPQRAVSRVLGHTPGRGRGVVDPASRQHNTLENPTDPSSRDL